MLKEPYIKPQMRSETLEPGALCCWGSQAPSDCDYIAGTNKASCSVCCEEPLFGILI